MTANASALVRLGQETDRARRACERVDGLGKPLAAAIRRAMPWLVRKRIEVSTEPARATLATEILESLPRPHHVTPLIVDGRYSGALVLDAGAVARAVDGVLAGGSGDLPKLDPTGLSPAQQALASRLAQGIGAALAEALGRAGIRVEPALDKEAVPRGGLFVACTIAIGTGDGVGRIVLLVPTSALDLGPGNKTLALPAPPENPAMLANVEVDVVAELGRVPMPLPKVASLKVGDVIRLPLGIDAMARVHVGGRQLFAGKPTTQGHQMAIEIQRHGA